MGALAMCEGRRRDGDRRRQDAHRLAGRVDLGVGGQAGSRHHGQRLPRARDAEQMGPVYECSGIDVGHVVHETTPQERVDHYRRDVVYCTSKELVADFLRDQIALGNLRTSAQTAVGMLGGSRSAQRADGAGAVPGDRRRGRQLLIDEAVTPLIISNSPDDEAERDALPRRRTSWRSAGARTAISPSTGPSATSI